MERLNVTWQPDEGNNEGASVARCSPNRWNPLLLPGAARTALKPCNLYQRRIGLRGNRERLVIVGPCKFERFHGALRPGKNTVFQHTSILVRPQGKECFKIGRAHACNPVTNAHIVCRNTLQKNKTSSHRH